MHTLNLHSWHKPEAGVPPDRMQHVGVSALRSLLEQATSKHAATSTGSVSFDVCLAACPMSAAPRLGQRFAIHLLACRAANREETDTLVSFSQLGQECRTLHSLHVSRTSYVSANYIIGVVACESHVQASLQLRQPGAT